MTREPRWISKRAALAIYEALLAEHGGAQGFVAEHLLDSALDSPKNHFAYGGVSDVFQLASAYARALTQDHPFVDGNKRVALTVALTFVERNGFVVAAPEPEAVQMVLDLSSQDVDASAFAQWLRNYVAASPPKKIARKTRAIRVVSKKRK